MVSWKTASAFRGGRGYAAVRQPRNNTKDYDGDATPGLRHPWFMESPGRVHWALPSKPPTYDLVLNVAGGIGLDVVVSFRSLQLENCLLAMVLELCRERR